MEIPLPNAKWVVGLSNGETLVEGKGKTSFIDGESSPWNKLQQYIKENDLTIQSLGIWIGDKHFNLPSVKPKFGGASPLKYNCFRMFASDLGSGKPNVQHYTCAEAIYKDYTVRMLIDEQDTDKMWIDIQDGYEEK